MEGSSAGCSSGRLWKCHDKGVVVKKEWTVDGLRSEASPCSITFKHLKAALGYSCFEALNLKASGGHLSFSH